MKLAAPEARMNVIKEVMLSASRICGSDEDQSDTTPSATQYVSHVQGNTSVIQCNDYDKPGKRGPKLVSAVYLERDNDRVEPCRAARW